MIEVWLQLEKIRSEVKQVRAAIPQAHQHAIATIASAPKPILADWARLEQDALAQQTQMISKVKAARTEITAKTRPITAKLNPKLQQNDSQAIALQQRVLSVTQQAEAALNSQETRWKEQLSALNPPITSKRQEVNRAMEQFKVQADTSARSLSDRSTTWISKTDAEIDAILDRSAALGRKIEKAIVDAEEHLRAPLRPIPERTREAREQIHLATAQARTTIMTPIDATLRTIEGQEAIVLGAIKTAREQLDAAERQLRAFVTQTQQGLDILERQGIQRVNSLLSQVTTVVETGRESLDGLRNAVVSIRTQILPPMEELREGLSQLKQHFSSGIQLLEGVANQASTALEAIQAEGLPKALVKPALTAIQGAVDTALPAVASGAEEAATQLDKAAQEIQSQVDKLQKKLVSQIEQLSTTIGKQIDAVVPPLVKQIQEIQAQIQTLLEQLQAQIQQMKESALATIQSTKQQVEATVNAVVDRLTTQIKALKEAIDTASQQANTAIKNAREQLELQARQLAHLLMEPAEQATAALAQVTHDLNQRISEAEASLRAQVDPWVRSIVQQLQSLRAEINALGKMLDLPIQTLQKDHSLLVADLRVGILTIEAIDQGLAPIQSAAMAQLSVISALVGALLNLEKRGVNALRSLWVSRSF